ncbi:hypothetical protein NM208_g10095 [Fusarium decemcellulare]|uniref:Uncharacterized protein n=1 Tax=Fusarium decemcellulare TaxID=57161 RepID=A0ACC1RZM8_9HYPO|nr:hypothetical protein NM208_g10095 [Fusarium decemcellulare]
MPHEQHSLFTNADNALAILPKQYKPSQSISNILVIPILHQSLQSERQRPAVPRLPTATPTPTPIPAPEAHEPQTYSVVFPLIPVAS